MNGMELAAAIASSVGEAEIDDDIIFKVLALLGGKALDDSSAAEEDDDLFFSSVEGARAIIERCLDDGPTPSACHAAYRVGMWVSSNSDRIGGTAREWQNLVSCLMGVDDMTALGVASSARKRYPYDAQLLAMAVRCAARLGDWTTCDALFEQAKDGEHIANEDWRFAVYVADYLSSKALTLPTKERCAAFEEAVSFISSARSRLGNLDQLVNKQAELLLESGKSQEAKNLLEDAIFVEAKEGHAAGGGCELLFPLAQCCVTYLDGMLSGTRDYQEIIRVCDKGISFSTTEQKAVKMGYFVYMKALAQDAIICGAYNSSQINLGNEKMVREALNGYALAYALFPKDSEYRGVAKERFLILKTFGGITDLSLDDIG